MAGANTRQSTELLTTPVRHLTIPTHVSGFFCKKKPGANAAGVGMLRESQHVP